MPLSTRIASLARRATEIPQDQLSLRSTQKTHSQSPDRPLTDTNIPQFPLRSAEIEQPLATEALKGESSSQLHRSPRSLDSSHVAGFTRCDYEAEHNEGRAEKTAEEKTEEEIVMKFVNKQSLLETQHRIVSKFSERLNEDEDDVDLHAALRASLQEESEKVRGF